MRSCTEEEVLADVQFRDYVFGSKSPLPAKDKQWGSIKEMFEKLEELRKGFRPKVRRSPVEGWLRRVTAIRAEVDPFAALDKHENLKANMAPLNPPAFRRRRRA